MPPPTFYQIRCVRGQGELPCHVTMILPGESAPSPPAADTFYFETPIPEGTAHHLQIGLFLNSWGNLEVLLNELLYRLLGSDRPSASAVAATLSNNTGPTNW